MTRAADAATSALYRAEWGRVLATLIRLTGDFAAAEEATQAAFEAAVVQFRAAGPPAHARAWLFATARHIAIDAMRRKRSLEHKLDTYAHAREAGAPEPPSPGDIPDDRLRLFFTCCHPALGLEAQVALTLRTLAGLDTDAIARAFVVTPATMAQRLVRAKRKIAAAHIPYVVPERSEMPERLHAVLTVLYLVFTEGYAATHGPSLMRTDLCAEAIRLATVLRALLGAEAPRELTGLAALMELHDARREARVDAAGDIVLLEDQDRSRWDAPRIAAALALAAEACACPEPGPFALQAGIAAEHARAKTKEDTDWSLIAALYAQLEAVAPSPVVALNRAVAVAMLAGPAAGLAIVDALAADGALDDFHLLHAARADLARRLGDYPAAEASYARALALARNASERRFLERRLGALRALGR